MGKGKAERLRAVDLYSGVGGWALGLRLAGIEVVASLERWGMANETNFKNNQHQAQTVDIRRLGLADLPFDIDIVVGSPPCTQFSYSNRGGNGDIEDGLEDIKKFLTVIDHLKPRFWAMENVPRVAMILEQELRPKGRLAGFRHLNIVPKIINMESFGIPQRRQRCIAGNFSFDLLESYAAGMPKRTLGSIIQSLAANRVVDPIYGLTLDKGDLRDHVTEDALSDEEVRINRASKTLHTVYNSMSFPDRLDRSVRTITATCTRVSRESIVIEDQNRPGTFRRLTVRERACLQGFPITFQFYGDSYAQKLRMVGNAIPPAFSYYVAQALQGRPADAVQPLTAHAELLKTPVPPAVDARPDKPGARYPWSRTFRFAIPSLRLKSGVRFDLANMVTGTQVTWRVAFYFGTSKSIQTLPLDESLRSRVLSQLPDKLRSKVRAELTHLADFIQHADISNMQKVWSHKSPGLTRPFMLLDQLDGSGDRIRRVLDGRELLARTLVGQEILAGHGMKKALGLPGLKKLDRNATLILSGLLVGSLANTEIAKRAPTATSKKLRLAAG